MRPPDAQRPPAEGPAGAGEVTGEDDRGHRTPPVGQPGTFPPLGLPRSERSALEVLRCTTKAVDAVLALASLSILEGRPLDLGVVVGALDRLCQQQAAAVAYLTALAAEAAA